ncbi:ROK family transcriptional regulator [Oceanibium sediminis]|uniref:ROK family transcriptional regulator n=1 Tax=Oceanibium sediminis TaxID=2026339 RepID=UPI000DD336DF|nr:ROK family transcriptional regulator [Oceanibium sediminis]
MITTSDIVLGANAERSRSHNRGMVLGQIRLAGRIGRADIARASGLSIQAVSNITSDLLEDGLIVDRGRGTAGRGHPPVLYALNPDGGYAIGVEIRPDAIFAGILNLCGETIASERWSLESTDRDTITQTLLRLRDHIVTKAGISERKLLGAGVVMPGPFGATGLSDSESDLPGWEDVAPGRWFAEHLGMPVLVENDANAAAMAERISGIAQSLDTFAFLYFGRGLGLGVIANGRLMAGAFGNAGEIGHIPVPCAGRTVPLESVVSRLSVQRALQQQGIDAPSTADLDRLFAAGDPVLMTWLDTAAEPLSAAITILENLFDPETVILGGALPQSILEHLVGRIRLSGRSVSERADRLHPRLMTGASGRLTATLGAAALVINQAFVPKIADLP